MTNPKARLAPPLGIAPTTEPTARAGLNALIYGVAKSGKTALAASLVSHPSVTKALHIDVDGSPESITPHPNLERATVPAGAAGWDRLKQLESYLYNGKHGYNTVIVDTLTTMGTYGLDATLRDNPSNQRGSKEKRLAFPTMADYGCNNRCCLRLVRSLRNLSIARGYHVIFVCHEKAVKAESGAVTYEPSLSGQLSDVVPGIPDLLGRLSSEKEGRVLQISPSKGIACDYRHDPTIQRTLPPRIKIKNFHNTTSEGMDLAGIWSAMLLERNGN